MVKSWRQVVDDDNTSRRLNRRKRERLYVRGNRSVGIVAHSGSKFLTEESLTLGGSFIEAKKSAAKGNKVATSSTELERRPTE